MQSIEPAEPNNQITKKRRFNPLKLALVVTVAASLLVLVFLGLKMVVNKIFPPEKLTTPSLQHLPSRMMYGIETNRMIIKKIKVKSGQTFAGLLKDVGVPDTLVPFYNFEASKHIDMRKIRAGQELCLLIDTAAGSQLLKHIIYEQNYSKFLIVHLTDSIKVTAGEKPVVRQESTISCIINSSLFGELEKQDANPELAVKLSQIFAWTIDFYKVQKNDAFKIIYENYTVEGKSVAIGEIKAALFSSKGITYYAFPYTLNGSQSWYDEKGNSLKKMFLKAPLKFSRISSAFTMKRFHPVLKVFKAHLGTDYAAPSGTPIMSVADGVVTDAKFNINNGNYVKVKHNGTYTTQYLHMSKIAKGIRSGKRVKQGDVIGYVGSTGLATGPHLCFRFWKNGKQVDPKKEKMQQGAPLENRHKADFLKTIQPLKYQLDKL